MTPRPQGDKILPSNAQDDQQNDTHNITAEDVYHPLLLKSANILFDVFNCGIAIFDYEGKIKYYNDRFAKLLKMSSHDVARLDLLAKSLSQEQKLLRNVFMLIRSRKDDEKLTVRFPNGQSRTSLNIMNVLENGRVKGVIMFEDISKVQQTDIQSLLSDAFRNPALIHDETGRVIQINAMCLKSLGFLTTDSQTMNLFDIERGLTPEKLAERIKRIESGTSIRYKALYVSWDGTLIPASVRSMILKTEDIKYILNVCEFDNTVLTKVQPVPVDIFSNMFDAIPIPALLWRVEDDEITLQMYNEAAVEATEGNVRSIVGVSIDKIFENMPEIKNAVTEVAISGHVIRGEVPCYSDALNMSGIFLLSFSRPNPNNVIMTITDITRHVNMQKRLHRQAKELTTFAHDMSHDIKALLHTIALHLELLEDEPDSSRFEEIRKIISHVDKLLTESVQLAEAGESVGRMVCCDLNLLIDEAVSLVARDSVKVIADSLPKIRCDDHKTHQIFQNIIRNAVEHGKATEITVRCVMDNQFINIYISNNGLPIPDELRDKILKRRASSKPHGGRGMLIVRRLVESHGWHIDLVDSEKVTFRIRIPKHFICIGESC